MSPKSDLSETSTATAQRTRVPLFSAFFMIYIFVSGGSFGIEEMVASSGPGLTLLLLLALPVIWALPMALVASELGSAIPDSGGFYVWTQRGLGRFWGFQAGWWWSLALLVDTSLYIVLSATYLQNQIGFSDGIYYAICWSVIAVCTVVNVLGIKIVAIGSSLFAILIISPIVVLGRHWPRQLAVQPIYAHDPLRHRLAWNRRRTRRRAQYRHVVLLGLRVHVDAGGRD